MARVAVGAVLVLAGLAKLSATNSFAQVLKSFPVARVFLTSNRARRLTAVVLPSVEIAAGLLFALGFGLEGVAIAILLLLLSFSSAIALALLRGEKVSCGCFGSDAKPITLTTLGRNLTLIGLTIVGVLLAGPSLDGVVRGQVQGQELASFMLVSIQGLGILAVLGAFLKLRLSGAYMRPEAEAIDNSGGLASVWVGVPEHKWPWRRKPNE